MAANSPSSGASSPSVQEAETGAWDSCAGPGVAEPARASMTSLKPPARKWSSPVVPGVTEGTSPADSRTSGPSAGTVAGSAVPRQDASARASPWESATASSVEARTSVPGAVLSSATAVSGSSTVVVTSAGTIAWPLAAESGNRAATRTATACGPDGKAHV
ncbi:hypothetical protein SDIAM103S_04742 [Streptomyces diastaticus subsp. diastaticus]